MLPYTQISFNFKTVFNTHNQPKTSLPLTLQNQYVRGVKLKKQTFLKQKENPVNFMNYKSIAYKIKSPECYLNILDF